MLLARTSAECHLYIRLNPCSCGASEVGDLEHSLESQASSEDLLAVYEGTCAACGRTRAFEFVLAAELPPAPPAYGGPAPSAIIDAGQFLATADSAAKSVPADLDALEPAARDAARVRLADAIACLDEVLKHIPEGADRVPEASLRSPLGQEVYRAEPGRFRKARLEAVRTAFRRALHNRKSGNTGGSGPAHARRSLADALVALPDRAAILERVEPDRALGALLGLAIGDALGTTNEFLALAAPPFPQLANGPVDDIVGGGPFGLEPGQVTDDTQMAVALAERLSAGASFSADAMMADYAAWATVAFDIGSQTRRAIDRAADEGALSAGRRVWDDASGRKPAGNGALMRCAPIGVFLATDGEARRQVAMADAATTHFDPRCQLASMAFTAAIARAITAEVSAIDLIETAEVELERGAALLRHVYRELPTVVETAYAELAADLAAARRDDPDLYGDELHLHGTQGFVRVAFRLAFWQILHAPSFEAAVIDVANRGGDADTNAAICGALWGAWVGVRAMRPTWVRAVLAARGLAGPDRSYHPEGFLRALWRAGDGGGRFAEALAPLIAEAVSSERGRLEPSARLVPAPEAVTQWPVGKGIEVLHRLRGEDRFGQFDGRYEGARVIISSVLADPSALESIERALPNRDISGLAPLRLLAPRDAAGAKTIVCVEERPAGLPLSSPGYPRSVGAARALGASLARIASAAHAEGAVLEGIRPEHVFALGRELTAVVPRMSVLGRFLAPSGSVGVAYPYDASFTAPEVQAGGAPTAAADVYSIGATVYFLLTRRAPHEERGLMAQIAASMKGPPAMDELDEGLAGLLVRALAAAPSQRPGADELAVALS